MQQSNVSRVVDMYARSLDRAGGLQLALDRIALLVIEAERRGESTVDNAAIRAVILEQQAQ